MPQGTTVPESYSLRKLAVQSWQPQLFCHRGPEALTEVLDICSKLSEPLFCDTPKDPRPPTPTPNRKGHPQSGENVSTMSQKPLGSDLLLYLGHFRPSFGPCLSLPVSLSLSISLHDSFSFFSCLSFCDPCMRSIPAYSHICKARTQRLCFGRFLFFKPHPHKVVLRLGDEETSTSGVQLGQRLGV